MEEGDLSQWKTPFRNARLFKFPAADATLIQSLAEIPCFLASNLATARMCTWSGPSANRVQREALKNPASEQDCWAAVVSCKGSFARADQGSSCRAELFDSLWNIGETFSAECKVFWTVTSDARTHAQTQTHTLI